MICANAANLCWANCVNEGGIRFVWISEQESRKNKTNDKFQTQLAFRIISKFHSESSFKI